MLLPSGRYPKGGLQTHCPRRKASFIPALVRLPRTSFSDCERAAKIPSMNLPAGVASMGDAQAAKMPAQDRMIELIPSEAIEV